MCVLLSGGERRRGGMWVTEARMLLGSGIGSRIPADTLPGGAGACDVGTVDPGNSDSKFPRKEDSSVALHGVDSPTRTLPHVDRSAVIRRDHRLASNHRWLGVT